MLSAQDILSIEFEKSMRGYRPEAVHDFLAQVAAQLEKVETEKADIEKKLYILAEKVEEYRKEEDMLKTAMINAQRMGENVIREAKQKAEAITRDADLRANLIDQKAKEKLEAEESNFLVLQEKVTAFKAQVLEVYKNHIESLSELPIMNSQEDFDAMADEVENEILKQPEQIDDKEEEFIFPQEPIIIHEDIEEDAEIEIEKEIEKEISGGFDFDNFEKEAAKTIAKSMENSQVTSNSNSILHGAQEIDFSSDEEDEVDVKDEEDVKVTTFSFDDEFLQDDEDSENETVNSYEKGNSKDAFNEDEIQKPPLRKSSIFEKYDDIDFND